jgi:low temperature requirement protein LtrA
MPWSRAYAPPPGQADPSGVVGDDDEMPLYVPMSSRDPTLGRRTSSPLELFFDLTFVVAVAEAGSAFQHGLVGGKAGSVLVGYPLVFFAIWWAWMNFTWFSSAYDTDDVPYRVAVLVQMAGVLVVAVGIPRALAHRDFAVILTGYLIMRMAMVGLWVRAAVSHPAGRATALRYAAGITVVEGGWVAWFFFVPHGLAAWVFLVLVAAELLVPIFAEAAGRTAWHPGHIAERYGAFTIIVLGEALSAGTFGVNAALSAGTHFGQLAPVVAGGLLTVFSMWWLYFDLPLEHIVTAVRSAFATRLHGAFAWGYGHYAIFASAAATGTGLAVATDQVAHHSQLSQLGAALCVTVPVSLYLVVAWALHAPYKPPSVFRNWSVPVAVVLIIASSATSQAVLATGLLLTALLALTLVFGLERSTEPEAPAVETAA